jgi:DNA-binding response OmpR family regulator
LPHFASAIQPATESQEAPQPFDSKSQRVLVVDDNEDAAETLALMLELDGQTVRIAHDGPDGVQEASDFRPDVVIMDIGLPGFDGLEAIRRIGALWLEPRPFMIALTGWSLEVDRLASSEAGADMHLAKPVDHAELRRVLESAAKRRGAAAQEPG